MQVGGSEIQLEAKENTQQKLDIFCCDHESLSIFVGFAKNLLSVRDPQHIRFERVHEDSNLGYWFWRPVFYH